MTLIVCEKELRGDGTKERPYRRILQIYTLDGKKIAEVDPKENRREEFHNPLRNE